MNDNILPVEEIQEMDVNMLLLEEFNCNDAFCEWFVQELNLPLDLQLDSVNGARIGVRDFGLGETDILFSYNSKKGKVFLLIENKIDASISTEAV